MKVKNMFGAGPVISFEFFPPKTDKGMENLYEAARVLQPCRPSFVSVTYGAGGSTRDRTIELVGRIKKELSMETVAHLTCVGSTKGEIRETMRILITENVENLLALRGDMPEGQETVEPEGGGYAHASDLVDYLANNYFVDIGAAGDIRNVRC